MFKCIILFTAVIAFVKAEGYYCPYESLGFDGRNDLLYDYYESNGDRWVRMGRTGWETRESYCRAKGDLSLHADAGRDKCIDSQGTCRWSGSSCEVDPSKNPDCYELCKRVSEGGGLQCLGNCPGGNSDRSQLYSICSNGSGSGSGNETEPRIVSRPRPRPKLPKPSSVRVSESFPMQIKQKKMTCVCTEEL